MKCIIVLLTILTLSLSTPSTPQFLQPLSHCRIPLGKTTHTAIKHNQIYVWLDNGRLLTVPKENLSVIYEYINALIAQEASKNTSYTVDPNPAIHIVQDGELKFTGCNTGYRTLVKGQWYDKNGKKTKDNFILDINCEAVESQHLRFLEVEEALVPLCESL